MGKLAIKRTTRRDYLQRYLTRKQYSKKRTYPLLLELIVLRLPDDTGIGCDEDNDIIWLSGTLIPLPLVWTLAICGSPAICCVPLKFKLFPFRLVFVLHPLT